MEDDVSLPHGKCSHWAVEQLFGEGMRKAEREHGEDGTGWGEGRMSPGERGRTGEGVEHSS